MMKGGIMIASLIIISLAFVWLLYESDWMRVRLPVGASNKLTMIEVTRDMLINPCLSKPSNNGYLSPGVEDILPGWEWLESRKHPVPEYRFEIIAWGCKHTIHLTPNVILREPNIVKNISRIALKPTKEQRQEIKRHNKIRKGSSGCFIGS
jgi:hypothetical protein